MATPHRIFLDFGLSGSPARGVWRRTFDDILKQRVENRFVAATTPSDVVRSSMKKSERSHDK